MSEKVGITSGIIDAFYDALYDALASHGLCLDDLKLTEEHLDDKFCLIPITTDGGDVISTEEIEKILLSIRVVENVYTEIFDKTPDKTAFSDIKALMQMLIDNWNEEDLYLDPTPQKQLSELIEDFGVF